jgi:hypothetical protein
MNEAVNLRRKKAYFELERRDDKKYRFIRGLTTSYEPIPELSKETQDALYEEAKFFDQKSTKFIRYNATGEFSNYAFKVIAKLFENKCSVLTLNKSKNYNINYGLNFEYIDISKDKKIYMVNLDASIPQISRCLSKDSSAIVLPITLPKHKNLMLYIRETNTFEYFEPHKDYEGDDYDFEDVKEWVIKLIDKLVLFKLIPEEPTIIWPSDLCYVGIQGLERGTERTGLCQVWSFIYLYFRLKFPDVAWTNIEKFIYKNTNIFGYLVDGFLEFILEEARKEFGEETLEFLNTRDKQRKFISIRAKEYVDIFGDLGVTYEFLSSRKTLRRVCLNLKTASSEDLLNYLLKDKDNIVININDSFYCLDKSHWVTDEKLIPVIPGLPFMTNRSTINYINTFPVDIRFFSFTETSTPNIYKLGNFYTLDEYILSD